MSVLQTYTQFSSKEVLAAKVLKLYKGKKGIDYGCAKTITSVETLKQELGK